MKKFLSCTILILISGFTLLKDEKNKGSQRAFYECSNPMEIDTTLFNIEAGKTYFFFDKKLEPKNLNELEFSGLENNPKGFFTAYLVNNSNAKFTATRQDGSLIMIQEALNEEGKWLPIEYWVYSGCGNSYFDPLELDSGKYVMIPIKKYTGSFDTQIRLKMKKDSTLFYSQPFEGSINKSQFKKETSQVNGILYRGSANYLEE